MKLAVGADHAGLKLKMKLVPWLKSVAGGRHQVKDMGTTDLSSVDYPDFAASVARAVSQGRASRGILVCGTGIGMAMAANKVHGIRAAVAWNPETAALASEHNKANVLCIPGRFLNTSRAQAMMKAFLNTPFGGGRHARRVQKINKLDHC